MTNDNINWELKSLSDEWAEVTERIREYEHRRGIGGIHYAPMSAIETISMDNELERLRNRKRAIEAKQIDLYEECNPVIPKTQEQSNSVTQNEIINAFKVKRDSKENEKWWKDRMGHCAKKYSGLLECRRSPGSRKTPSMWNPASVAAWLIGKEHMLKPKAILEFEAHFPDHKDLADMLN